MDSCELRSILLPGSPTLVLWFPRDRKVMESQIIGMGSAAILPGRRPRLGIQIRYRVNHRSPPDQQSVDLRGMENIAGLGTFQNRPEGAICFPPRHYVPSPRCGSSWPHTASRTASLQALVSEPSFLTTVLCALGGFALLLGLASREQRLQRWTWALSGLVWAALLALGHGFLFTGGVVSAWDQVRGGTAQGVGGHGRPTPQPALERRNAHPGLQPSASGPPQVSFFLFVIFTAYTMLPLGMRVAIAAGLASSLSHLLVLGLYLGPQPDSRPALLPQVSSHPQGLGSSSPCAPPQRSPSARR